ncbi:hypothetical protein [Paracoccus onubensis]|uniref:Uncharacterized protein n=1 Tax=Paracoccus onubensis TaxID=1675788 RepID=A0A418SX11_9RHOB|nr:hypothetical protein [Paracoccus onubensis]RJE85460.1 hypothetical protein D3P04_10685 [Paracoccus onubensis]
MRSSDRSKMSLIQSGRLNIFERYRSEYATYGFAISHFSGLEQGLLAVFIHLDERPAEDSIAAYWSIKSCRGRYEWIEKRVKNLSPRDDFARSWLSIRDRLDHAIEVRNQLAHGEFTPIGISHDQEIVGFWARLAKTASTAQLSFNNDTKMIEGCPFFSAEQLIEQGLEFIDLSENLFAILNRERNR